MIDWIFQNWIEVFGALAGIVFLYLEIKENKYLWPVGILTSLMYIYIFFFLKFYADMALQFYYVAISIYGWILWNKHKNSKELPISRLSKDLFYVLALSSCLIYGFILYILLNFTDSPLPYWDSFTTALSIVATYMLTKKILEQWLLWVVVNAVSLGLYIYKGLYPTSILFVFYTILAVVGYIQWRKSCSKKQIV